MTAYNRNSEKKNALMRETLRIESSASMRLK